MLIISLFFYLINPQVTLKWRGYEVLKEKGHFNQTYKVFPSSYLGPEGGIITYPISSAFNVKKVIAPSLFEYHKCENVFAGDTFEIVIPYGIDFLSPGKKGIMTGVDRFLLARDSVSYYFTTDNFFTIDTITLTARIGEADSKDDTVYMIVGDSLLKSIDGGQTFGFIFDIEDSLGTGSYHYSMDIFPFNSNIISIYALADTFGYFLYSSDGGFSFTKNLLPYQDVVSLRFLHSDPNYIFMITDVGIVYTSDAGVTWDTIQINYTFPLPVYPIYGFDLLPLYPDTFLFSSFVDRGIYKVFYNQILGGWYYSIVDTNFIPFFFEPIYKNGNLYDTFYVGSNDGIYYTTDKGKTWIKYKNRLKAVLFQGPSQACSRKDTAFVITGGGMVYRSFDILNTGFEELSFKGNIIFLGNNMIDNFYNSPDNLYLITPIMRVLDPSLYRILFYSSDAGNSFMLRNSDNALSYFYDMIPGSDVNTFYLWDNDSIIKTSTSGSSFTTVIKFPGNIDYVNGEGDTIFILKTSDSLYASFDGGLSFTFLDSFPNASEIYYVKGSEYVFFPDDATNHLMYYDLTNSVIDTAIRAPSTAHVILHASPSYDNYIYVLYYDTLNLNYEIYYRAMPDGNVMNVLVEGLDKPVGIFALENGNLLIYELGRGLYLMSVTSVNEFAEQNKNIIRVPSLVSGDFLRIDGLRNSISYSIFDISGRRILKGSLSAAKGKINLKFLRKGVYYIETEKQVYKFIKF